MAHTVTDIDAVSDHSIRRGSTLHDERKQYRGVADQLHHPKDSGGVLIELVQHAAE